MNILKKEYFTIILALLLLIIIVLSKNNINNNSNNSNFFYPSTIFINNKDKSHYSLLKNAFEKKIRLLKNFKSKINVARIPKLNTRQNLNLFNEKLPNFRDIIFKNREIRKKIFFFN